MKPKPQFETITLVGGVQVTADLSRSSKCHKCQEPIVWAVTKNVKNMPICQDGNGRWVSHFATCKFAAECRNRREPGSGDTYDELLRQNQRDRW